MESKDERCSERDGGDNSAKVKDGYDGSREEDATHTTLETGTQEKRRMNADPRGAAEGSAMKKLKTSAETNETSTETKTKREKKKKKKIRSSAVLRLMSDLKYIEETFKKMPKTQLNTLKTLLR